MALRTYQVGSPRKRGEGLRIGTVRFPSRGVHKEDYARLDFFDVWFPVVAPSHSLMTWAKTHDIAGDAAANRAFHARYARELETNPAARQSILLLAALAQKTSISVTPVRHSTDCCVRMDSNHRAISGSGLQPDAFNRSATRREGIGGR
jgi:uncharacterized protein YeaO (DUF488 family)